MQKQAATCIPYFRHLSERIACSANVLVCLLAMPSHRTSMLYLDQQKSRPFH